MGTARSDGGTTELRGAEEKGKEKQNPDVHKCVWGGVGAWINHRRKGVGRERRKGGRGSEWAPEASKAELDPGWRKGRKRGRLSQSREGGRGGAGGQQGAGPGRCAA